MSEPRLYEWYDRDQAVALFGDPARAQHLCDGQWTIFPGVAVCTTGIGAPPHKPHFVRGSEFAWVADKPYRLHDGRYDHFVPVEVIAGKPGSRRPIRLFVRPEGSEKYLYVGELGPSHMLEAPGAKGHGTAHFELRPTLPSNIWHQIGGLRSIGDDGGQGAVDRALSRLHGPTTVDDRLDVLRELVGYWHGPIRADDAFPEAQLRALRVPRPLKWWYGWAGRRTRIMSGQNILLGPPDERRKDAELEMEDGRLLFYLENQAVYRWATLPEGEDPPVFGRYERHKPWEPEGIRLSEHLILACMFEAVTCHSPYGAAAACLPQATLTEIEQFLTPVAIGPWRWLGPTRFYARNGAFMYSMPNGDGVYSVWLGAKTEQPLQFLKPYLDEQWEHAAL